MGTQIDIKKSLRESKKRQSRQRILEAAAALFKLQGYSETSIADIMQKARLGVGTFYNYFDSKETLLLALLEGIASEVDEAVEFARSKHLSSIRLLNLASSVMTKLLDENRFVLPLFLSASEHSDRPELMPTRQFVPTFKPMFEVILNQGQESGEIRRDVPANLIAEMFHSIYQAASFSRLDMSFSRNIELKVRILIDGIKI